MSVYEKYIMFLTRKKSTFIIFFLLMILLPMPQCISPNGMSFGGFSGVNYGMSYLVFDNLQQESTPVVVRIATTITSIFLLAATLYLANKYRSVIFNAKFTPSWLAVKIHILLFWLASILLQLGLWFEIKLLDVPILLLGLFTWIPLRYYVLLALGLTNLIFYPINTFLSSFIPSSLHSLMLVPVSTFFIFMILPLYFAPLFFIVYYIHKKRLLRKHIREPQECTATNNKECVPSSEQK